MMNIACNLSCSVAVMVLLTGTALAYPDTSSKSLKLNTHTYSRNSIRESAHLSNSSSKIQLAKVCFITDQGTCSGNEFNRPNDIDNGGSPVPPDGGDKDPDYELDPDKQCQNEGYVKIKCNAVQNPYNFCPYDKEYIEKCICKPELISCPSPLVGVGLECGGKYLSCKCPSNYKPCPCGKGSGASSCTWNGETLYSSCTPCCTPQYDQYCSNPCGRYSCSDGCGGSRWCCDECPVTPPPSGGGGGGGSSGGGGGGGDNCSYNGEVCINPCQMIGAVIEYKCTNRDGSTYTYTMTQQYYSCKSTPPEYHSAYCRAEREKCDSVNCIYG